MKRCLFALLALVAFAHAARAQDIVVPATVNLRQGHMTLVSVQSTVGAVKWINLNQDVDVIPFPDGVSAVVCVPPTSTICAGGKRVGDTVTYKIGVYGAKLGKDGKTPTPTDPAYIQLVVTLPGPTPPGPGPGPGPGPTDPLTALVATAYAQETDAGKAGEAVLFSALYTYVASQVATAGTWQALQAAMVAQATKLNITGKLQVVQAAVTNEFVKEVPGAATGTGAISAADATAAAAFWNRAAAVVGAQK